MANNPSAKKRIKIANRNRLQNRFYKSAVKTLTKVYLKNLKEYETSTAQAKKAEAQKLLNSVYSLLDKGTKTHVFHKNNSSRKKSKLLKHLINVENSKV